ncbi:MAG: 1-(5-phosphoribosyl)-5-[(5-phosphoribosylamino)methylideneamino]imidazole-4-carboxamide isomerase [Chloroflexota bacterium]
MIIYPAIDLRGGRCVRLVEGDFNRETQYDADPADAARRWAAAGAQWLHVVDLDGAVAGRPTNVDAIAKIRNAVDIPIQLGGGLREADHLKVAFDLGVDRVILGTAALTTPDLVINSVAHYGDRVAVGLDARDGRLAASGWLEQTDALATEVAIRLRAEGVQHFVSTDIARDGTLSGPNVGALKELHGILGHGVIASGGVGTLDDLRMLRDAGIGGAIVGRAIYDGRVHLAEAIALASALSLNNG